MLVCVLWALAILTVLTLGFGRRALLERRAAAISIDHIEAHALARGAVQRGLAEIQNRAFVDALAREQASSVQALLWAGPSNLLEGGEVFESSGGPEYPDDSCSFSVCDAERRISVNAAPEEILEEIPGISFRTVNAIMRRRGGELSSGRVSPFLAVEEIRYLDGVDDDQWFGDAQVPGLRDLLTVWGDGRVNVNSAGPDVLRCIPDLDEDVIGAILAYRQGPDGQLYTQDDRAFPDLVELARITGVSPERLAPISKYCKLESKSFTITGRATRRAGKVRAECAAVVLIHGERAVVLDWREGPGGS
ncbi:MAG: hypothetical protein JXR94_11205 [Candidatus Hydrogenedentes bacterium]|nr:hypothetical protein [Candidatus Hydrogenedentota bacterium]